MKRHWIPRHLGGMVALRWAALAGVAYWFGGAWASFVVLVLLLANFVDDQTVHLSQENHKGADLSYVESGLVLAPWLFRPLAWLTALLAVAALFRP